MYRYFILIKGEFVSGLIHMKRYWFNTIVEIFGITVFFLLIFLGVTKLGSEVNMAVQEKLVVGYLLSMFGISAFSQTAGIITSEAMTGTLEQLFLSPLNVKLLFIVKILNGFVYSIIFMIPSSLLAMTITQVWPAFNLLRTFPLIIMSVIGVWGLGFIMAGLTTLYKKTSAVNMLINFSLIPSSAVKSYPFSMLSLLPFAPGAYTIMQIITEQKVFPLWWYAFIAVYGLCWFLTGYFFYNKIEAKALKSGSLGHY